MKTIAWAEEVRELAASSKAPEIAMLTAEEILFVVNLYDRLGDFMTAVFSEREFAELKRIVEKREFFRGAACPN